MSRNQADSLEPAKVDAFDPKNHLVLSYLLNQMRATVLSRVETGVFPQMGARTWLDITTGDQSDREAR